MQLQRAQITADFTFTAIVSHWSLSATHGLRHIACDTWPDKLLIRSGKQRRRLRRRCLTFAAVELVGPIKTVVEAVTERCSGEETESPVTLRLTRLARCSQRTQTHTRAFNIILHVQSDHVAFQSNNLSAYILKINILQATARVESAHALIATNRSLPRQWRPDS